MVDYEKEYYTQPRLWKGKNPLKTMSKRGNKTISLIPDDVKTILDVGCGNGAIINTLRERGFNCFGVDINKEGLKYVKCKKKQMSCNKLYFKNNSFDLIICSEVLEHLSLKVYIETLKELQRVAKKYIIVVTPYKRNLREGFTKCKKCGTTFNAINELSEFDEKKYDNLFKDFKLKKLIYVGREKKQNWFERFLRYRLGDFYCENELSICPACGYRNDYKQKHNLFSLLSALSYRVILHKESARWIGGLYVA